MPARKKTKRTPSVTRPSVGIIMGSISDWKTMRHAAAVLADFGIAHEKRVVSAHRTPGLLYEYASTAESRGLRCIIAGAGGAAHLPGMTASMTTLPVLGVPVKSKALKGMDSLLSIVQMPGGVPVATFAIGDAGATNAALFAVSLLAAGNAEVAKKLKQFRARQTANVLASQEQLDAPEEEEEDDDDDEKEEKKKESAAKKSAH
jgi:5-(carboxyamino)imidazole ribonucleotide mutase